MTEGVDYSSTANANWTGLAKALRANGKMFAGRYAVRDKSPARRGITNAEYLALRAEGVDVFLYYEENEAWMNSGWDRGVAAAQVALSVVKVEKMPEAMPIYYSCDTPPEQTNFAEVVQCLRGAASVVGFDRVAFYGGIDIVRFVVENRAAKRICQTYAWSGTPTVWHPDVCLHQYDNYNNFIFGTDVDLVRSMKSDYGQASLFSGGPIYAEPIPPPLRDGKPYPHIDKNEIPWLELTPRRWKALERTERRQRASENAAEVGKPIAKGDTVTFIYSVSMPDGSVWFISKSGSRCRAEAFLPEG